MNFIIKKENTVKWPVSVSVPQNGGSFSNQDFEVEFLLLGIDEATNLTEKAGDADKTLLLRVIRGWELLKDETGNDVPYNEANLEMVLGIPFVRRGLLTAYFNAATGGRAQAKN